MDNRPAPDRPRGGFAARLLPECGLVPGLVMPLAIVLAPTPYIGILAALYVAATVAVDEYAARHGGPVRATCLLPAGSARLGDMWLLLFALELVVFLAVALATVSGGAAGWQLAGLAATTGLILAVNFNVAHDLIHRLGDRWRWGLGFGLLMVSLDSQLSISHVHGHHANVGTPEDPATARRGEPFHRFFVRSTLGQYREAWQFEAKRLRRHHRRALSLRNRVLIGAAGSAVICALVWAGFGSRALLVYLAACLMGKALFESANYIQHYGLVRRRRRRVEARHSWDCYGAATRYFMFNQNHHANHHVAAERRCWELRREEGAVRMPYGYITMMLAAAVPPLWFHLMDPLVDRWHAASAVPQEAGSGGSPKLTPARERRR